MRFGIPRVADRRVFLLQPVDRRAELVLIGPCLGLDRVGEHRLREGERGHPQGGSGLTQQVARRGFLQLRHGAHVTGPQFGHVRLRLALQDQQVSESLGRVAGDVVHGSIGGEGARDDPQHRDAARERIRQRLPDHRDVGSRGGRGDLHLAGVRADGHERPLDGGGNVAHQRVEQRLETNCAQSGRADQREEAPAERGIPQSLFELFLGQGARLEEHLHQAVVGLGHHLDERGARLVGGLRQLRRHVGLGYGAAAVVGERDGAHPHQIDDAREGALLADGNLDGNDGAGARVPQALERSREARALAVEAAQRDQTWQAARFGGCPHGFGLDLGAVDGVRHDENGFHHAHGGPGLGQEAADAGRIDDVDLGAEPFGVRQAGREGMLAGDGFVFEVGDGRPVIHASQPVDGTSREERG